MYVLYLSGVAGITTLAIILQKGAILKKTTENIWIWINYLLNIVVMFWVGLTCSLVYTVYNRELQLLEWLFVILFYIVTYIVRGFTFALLKPLLATMGYGMSWQEAMVATLGGIKHGSLTLPLAFACRAIYSKEKHFFNTLVMVYMSGIFVLSFVINDALFGPLVRLLQVEKVSLAKKGNMSRAVEFVHNTRQRTLDTLKLDRTTADANWLIVTNCTQLKHPYMTAVEVDDEIHSDSRQARISTSVTKKKSAVGHYKDSRPAISGLSNLYYEQLREANRRILKVKRVCILKKNQCVYCYLPT